MFIKFRKIKKIIIIIKLLINNNNNNLRFEKFLKKMIFIVREVMIFFGESKFFSWLSC